MKTSWLLLFLVSIMTGLMACKSTSRSAAAERQNPTPNQQWMLAVNSANWDDIYMDNAVKVESNGRVINGQEAIINSNKQAGWQIKTIATDKIINTHQEKLYQYEIGKFSTTDGQTFHHLLIWNLSGEKPRREFEFVGSKEIVSSSVLVEIDQRRAEWIKLCNEHNAANLVEELYRKDAIYYNHKPIIRGREAIIADYQYMNQPKYNLLLTPILLQAVNETLAFEIGQCSGSYGGKYILVWQKNVDGKWYISMDANL